jgi:uncharacterized membrane protein YbhN (UPF0104 family)
MKRIGSSSLLWLKILVSLGLLSILVSRMDLAQLFRVLASADFSYVAAVLLAYLLSQILSCFRWLLLARPLGFRLSFGEFLSFYFIGMFFNLFSPSTIGGDVGRVFYLARNPGSEGKRTAFTAYALISVLADRAIGMAVLVWMGAVALFIFSGYSVSPAIRYTTYAIALGTLLAGVGVPFLGWLLRREGDPLRNGLSHALEVYRKSRSPLLQAFLISAAVHVIQGALQKLLGHALGLDLPWSFCFILYPLVGTFSALPISFNGIGLREGGYLFLLRLIDVGSEKAVAFGLLWFVVIVLDSLIGGLFFVLRKSPGPSTSPSMERP